MYKRKIVHVIGIPNNKIGQWLIKNKRFIEFGKNQMSQFAQTCRDYDLEDLFFVMMVNESLLCFIKESFELNPLIKRSLY